VDTKIVSIAAWAHRSGMKKKRKKKQNVEIFRKMKAKKKSQGLGSRLVVESGGA